MNNQQPNVILIVLDTQRVDRLGTFGAKVNTSPNLDAFAKKCTVFNRAISPAQWTIPSHASMFCGEYPSTHNALQSGDALNPRFKTIAEYLVEAGYETVGFCNNPLVGVLDNGFRRGFRQFYNYGGTVPFTPSSYGDDPKELITKIKNAYFRLIDRIATPIQQAVAASPKVLQFSLNPWLVPLWTRYSNFKGDTDTSISDTFRFLSNQKERRPQKPFFLFLNLMETHLPYTPPKRFIRKFAPIVLEEPKARDFLRLYNTQALKWLLPLEQPYPKLEAQTLSDMYDAEVAYQDHLLNALLTLLDENEFYRNSLVIITADHGEMLGEHQIMGHGLGVHEELVHVPLIIRYPGQVEGGRVESTVSCVHIFHTILDLAGISPTASTGKNSLPMDLLSLKGQKPGGEHVFSEAYPPNNLLLILEKYAPNLIDPFNCRETHWASYNGQHKLVRIDNVREELYDVSKDPLEQYDLYPGLDKSNKLSENLDTFLRKAKLAGSPNSQYLVGNIADEGVLERLRKLGYIE